MKRTIVAEYPNARASGLGPSQLLRIAKEAILVDTNGGGGGIVTSDAIALPESRRWLCFIFLLVVRTGSPYGWYIVGVVGIDQQIEVWWRGM